MPDIKCPKCGHEFLLEEALNDELKEVIEKEKKELRQQMVDYKRAKEEEYHFSISHCGDYAAAIVSKNNRVGIDIEIPVDKIIKIKDKFLSANEQAKWLDNVPVDGFNARVEQRELLTLLWSSKESVFKWYGDGGVDFSEQIQLQYKQHDKQIIECFFTKAQFQLPIHYHLFDQLVLSWIVS